MTMHSVKFATGKNYRWRLLVLQTLACIMSLNIVAAAEPAPSRADGCARPKTPSGLVDLGTDDGAGRMRTYRVQAPSNYDAARRYPVFFVFHGAGGSAANAASFGLQRVAGASGLGIFVFPEGRDFQGQGIGWDDRRDGYDLPFFEHMLRDLNESYCIDDKQIFAAGFSWGGDFVIALACNRGELLRAVAINSAVDEFKDVSDYKTYLGLPCRSERHPALRFEHAVDGDSAYPAPDFATTSQLLRHLNACGASAGHPGSSSAGSECSVFSGCAVAVTECSFAKNIGHALPPNWANDTWSFFVTFLTADRAGTPK